MRRLHLLGLLLGMLLIASVWAESDSEEDAEQFEDELGSYISDLDQDDGNDGDIMPTLYHKLGKKHILHFAPRTVVISHQNTPAYHLSKRGDTIVMKYQTAKRLHMLTSGNILYGGELYHTPLLHSVIDYDLLNADGEDEEEADADSEDTNVRIYVEPATLMDAFDHLEFSHEEEKDDKDESDPHKAAKNADGFTTFGKPLAIASFKKGIDIKAKSDMDIKLNPSFKPHVKEASLKVKGGHLHHLGLILEADISLQFKFKWDFWGAVAYSNPGLGHEFLPQKKVGQLVIWAGIIPILVNFYLGVNFSTALQVSGKIQVRFEHKESGVLRIGTQYDHGKGWHNPGSGFLHHHHTTDGPYMDSAPKHLVVQPKLIPSFKALFYGLAGPSFNLMIWAKLDLSKNAKDKKLINWAISAGASVSVSFAMNQKIWKMDSTMVAVFPLLGYSKTLFNGQIHWKHIKEHKCKNGVPLKDGKCKCYKGWSGDGCGKREAKKKCPSGYTGIHCDLPVLRNRRVPNAHACNGFLHLMPTNTHMWRVDVVNLLLRERKMLPTKRGGAAVTYTFADTVKAVRAFQKQKNFSLPKGELGIGCRTIRHLGVTLRKGSARNLAVYALLTALNKGKKPAGKVKFDDGVEKRVREFQNSHHISVDGVVGPDTWSRLMLHP